MKYILNFSISSWLWPIYILLASVERARMLLDRDFESILLLIPPLIWTFFMSLHENSWLAILLWQCTTQCVDMRRSLLLSSIRSEIDIFRMGAHAL